MGSAKGRNVAVVPVRLPGTVSLGLAPWEGPALCHVAKIFSQLAKNVKARGVRKGVAGSPGPETDLAEAGFTRQAAQGCRSNRHADPGPAAADPGRALRESFAVGLLRAWSGPDERHGPAAVRRH